MNRPHLRPGIRRGQASRELLGARVARPLVLAAALALGPRPSSALPPPPAEPVELLARAYTQAVERINDAHARKPGNTREADLGKRLPQQARAALEKVLKAGNSPGLAAGLLACGEAALDLDLLEDFERVRKRLGEVSPGDARKLGTALSRPRFILRGIGGLEAPYLEEFARVLEAVLAAYDELFGFEEWSKVPGKKLRVRIHVEEKITRPPHFAPQFPFHSEIDFPVADGSAFRSPTPDGKFLFYGLCHELGHVVAMWGDAQREEDQHTWAHYTGTLLVERLSAKAGGDPGLEGLLDVRWRSLSKERERLQGTAPSLADKDGILALFIALHDKVGPGAIGAALNQLDRQDRRRRINRVRYYSFRELREALLSTLKRPEERQAVAEIIPAAGRAATPKSGGPKAR